jgi:hypothetical protein
LTLGTDFGTSNTAAVLVRPDDRTSGAAQGFAAVVRDHVAQRGEHVDRAAGRGAVEFGVRAVEIADDAFGVGPVRVRAEVGVPGGVQRGTAGGPAELGELCPNRRCNSTTMASSCSIRCAYYSITPAWTATHRSNSSRDGSAPSCLIWSAPRTLARISLVVAGSRGCVIRSAGSSGSNSWVRPSDRAAVLSTSAYDAQDVDETG